MNEVCKERTYKEPKFGEWTSVNDQLPRVGEYVIAYGDNGPKGCCMAFVGSDDDFICEINGYYVEAYGVTHWMPLPEKPIEYDEIRNEESNS